MDNELNIRIKDFLKYLDVSSSDVSAKTGIGLQNILNMLGNKHSPSATNIIKLVKTYPQLNARWLLTGYGEMINETNQDMLGDNEVAYGSPFETIKAYRLLVDKLSGTIKDKEKIIEMLEDRDGKGKLGKKE